jgi:hypothetical protein
MLLMVLISEIALAPPLRAARAAWATLVMLGVSLTMTGISAASMTQPTMVSITSGFWPTAEPMPRSHMPCGQPKFSSTPSAPVSADRLSMSCQFSRVSVISEAMTARSGQRCLHSAISRKFVAGERSLISSMLLKPAMRTPSMMCDE